MIIKNFKTLATSKTRKDALEIVSAGIEAVLVKPAMHKQIKILRNILKIQGHRWNLAKYKRIFVVGAGKAAADMAEATEEIFRKRIVKGIVIDTQKRLLSRIKVRLGTHPWPSKGNISVTKEIMKILESAREDDLVIVLISGGGSSLLAAPRISLQKQIQVNKILLKSGATIQEINTVRKHLSYIKGGQLAQMASPATLITLIVSDVIDNNLDVIASGPTVKDSTSVKDAEKIQEKYSLPKLPFTETPKEGFLKATNILLITNTFAAEAMKKKATKLGYKAKIFSTKQVGEAREIGKMFAKCIQPGKALLATGETTVTVKGKGKGGRNQELVIGASKFIKRGVILSCGSDGNDFIKEVAGGIVDECTEERAKEASLDSKKFLKDNDSYGFLSKLGDTIITGKTGTNVGDLIIALGKK